MATEGGKRTGARKYVVEEGLARWPTTHAEAWIGLLETYKRLTRELEAELEAKHGLTISGLEVMSRLAAADGRTLRHTTLAEEAGLSLSRVSRIVDMLEERGLIERKPCSEDARAKNACLTRKGFQLLRAAQRTHFAGVERRFFDQISERDVAALARAFSRFVDA